MFKHNSIPVGLTLTLIFALAVPLTLVGQSNLENVHLFQSYHFDTPITKTKLVEGDIAFSNYDGGSAFSMGARGVYPVNEKLEIDAQLHFANSKIDNFDGKSGLTDIGVYGRYFLKKQDKTTFSAGGVITLPIGSDKLYSSNYLFQALGSSVLNFGAFGAMRHILQNGMIFTANAGLFFFEAPSYSDSDRETSFNIGVGTIYPYSAKMNIVGELYQMSKFDFMMLSGGVDYNLGKGKKARGMLGLGLDDGAPDLMILGGYEITL